jgi:hypothetical protein
MNPDRRREKTTFAVIFTSSQEADICWEERERDWKDGRENGIGKREREGIGKKVGTWEWRAERERNQREGQELGLERRRGRRIKEKRRKGKELERSTGMERDWEDEQE